MTICQSNFLATSLIFLGMLWWAGLICWLLRLLYAWFSHRIFTEVCLKLWGMFEVPNQWLFFMARRPKVILIKCSTINRIWLVRQTSNKEWESQVVGCQCLWRNQQSSWWFSSGSWPCVFQTCLWGSGSSECSSPESIALEPSRFIIGKLKFIILYKLINNQFNSWLWIFEQITQLLK